MITFILSLWRSRTSLESLLLRSDPSTNKLVEIPTTSFLEDPEFLSSKCVAEWLASLVKELQKYETINNTLKLLSSKPIGSLRGAASDYKKEWAELEASAIADPLHYSRKDNIQFELIVISNSRAFNRDLEKQSEELFDEVEISFLQHSDEEALLSKLDDAIEAELNGEYDLSADVAIALTNSEKDSPLWQLYLSAYYYWERNILYPYPQLRVVPIKRKA